MAWLSCYRCISRIIANHTSKWLPLTPDAILNLITCAGNKEWRAQLYCLLLLDCQMSILTDDLHGCSSNCYIWYFNIAYVGSIQETTVLAAQIVKSETYYKVVPQSNDGTPTFIFLFAASREEKWITVPYTHTSSFVSEKPVWNSLIGDAAALHNVTYCSVSIPLPATAQPNRKRSVLNECVYPARFLGRRRWPNSWRTTVVVV